MGQNFPPAQQPEVPGKETPGVPPFPPNQPEVIPSEKPQPGQPSELPGQPAEVPEPAKKP